jgi:hypothetical protein
LDPFKFNAKSFSGINTAITSQQYPSPMGRKRTRNPAEKDNHLALLERKLQARRKLRDVARSANKPKKKHGSDEDDDDGDDDDDDDDGDVEIVQNKRSKSSQSQESGNPVINLLDDSDSPSPVARNSTISSTVKGKAMTPRTSTGVAGNPLLASASTKLPRRLASASKQAVDYEMLSSDDEEDGAVTNCSQAVVTLPKAVVEAMNRARKAESNLVRAQHYHAHDVHVEVDDGVPLIRRPAAAAAARTTSTSTRTRNASHTSSSLPVNLGKLLRFKCRAKRKGEKHPSEIILCMKEKEPFQVLFDKFITTQSLDPNTTKVTMVFDGEVLNGTKTPQQYDMEDEDLIDVVIG